MDKFLIIKKPGMFINIPGSVSFRTPCVIDISKISINNIITELRKNGIRDYKVVSDGQAFQVSDAKKNRKGRTEDSKTTTIDSKSVDELFNKFSTKHDETFEKIEKLLTRFINMGLAVKPSNIEEPSTVVKKKKTVVDEHVEEFIPEININNIKVKGLKNTSEKTIKSKLNLKSVENLTEITKKE